MASAQDCERALQTLADRLADNPDHPDGLDADRSLSCTIKDLSTVFRGRLSGGRLHDIAPSADADAQIRITVSSDDLVALVDGTLSAPSAFATGRLKVRAGIRDMMRLRSLF